MVKIQEIQILNHLFPRCNQGSSNIRHFRFCFHSSKRFHRPDKFLSCYPKKSFFAVTMVLLRRDHKGFNEEILLNHETPANKNDIQEVREIFSHVILNPPIRLSVIISPTESAHSGRRLHSGDIEHLLRHCIHLVEDGYAAGHGEVSSVQKNFKLTSK